MRRNLTISVFVVVCFVLQSTLFKQLSFDGISPNLLIVLTSAFGFMYGPGCGLTVGFFSGLLIDIFFGDVLGFYALIYMYIGYINGIFQTIFYKEDIKLPLLLITVSDLTNGMITYLLLFLLRSRFHLGFYFSHVIFPEMAYTILVSIVLYPLLLTANRYFEKLEQRSVS